MSSMIADHRNSKSGTLRKNSNSPGFPELSPTIPDNRGSRSEISNITDHLRYISIFPTYEKPALIYHWRPITFSFVLPSHFYFVGFDLFHDIRFKSVLFHFGFLKLCCSS